MANIDFPLNPTAGQRYTFAGVTYTFSAQGVWVSAASAAAATIPQGRLTLQSGVPVMTTTSVGHTAIFYTPYVGNKVPIFDGTSVGMRRFDELQTTTVDFTNNPAPLGPNKVNDWFVFRDAAGTMRICHGPDWTDDVTRSAGTILIRNEGLLLNNANITNGPAAQRGTYVGTTLTNANSQLDWIYGTRSIPPTAGWFGVWNMYFRAQVSSFLSDATANWTYNSVVIRQSNNQPNARFTFVSGMQEDTFSARSTIGASVPSAGAAMTGIGFDSTTVMSGIAGTGGNSPAFSVGNGRFSTSALGKHFMAQLEAITNDGTVYTIYGQPFLPNGANVNGMYFDGRF